MNSIMNTAVSALHAHGVSMLATANNVANMNTHGFKADQVRFQDTANFNGVEVGAITKDTSAGAPVPPYPQDTVSISAQDANAAADAAALQQLELNRATEMREASNVQLEREFTNLIATEHAYAANAQTVRAYDDMMGTVIDMVV